MVLVYLKIGALSLYLTQTSAPPNVSPALMYEARSYNQHAYTKIRPESLLQQSSNANMLVFQDPPFTHGALQTRRDNELLRHYTRIAELDAVDELAKKMADHQLQERVEEIRRKEVNRFYAAMQRIFILTREEAMGFVP